MARALVAVAAALAVTACGGSRPSTPSRATLRVTPARSLLDRPVRVTVDGLSAGATATLTARWRSIDGTLWGSRQTLRGRAGGRVVLRGVDGMRFLWSMRPLHGHPKFFGPSAGTSAIRLELSRDGHALARATLYRRAYSPGVKLRRLRLRSDRLDGYFYAPAPGRARGPAVLALGGSEGGAPADLAAGLASYGYPTLALHYFKRPGLPRMLDRVPLEYFARALRWLARRPGVDPRRVIVNGGSRGGEAALLIASTYPRLAHGAIGIVPSYEVAAACCQTASSAAIGSDPAWTLHGRPVAPSRIIPVERISGPVLVAGAGQDGVWDSSFYTSQIDQRLSEQHFRHRHQRLDFADAGHVMPGAESPGADTDRFGGTQRANAAAGEVLWRATLRYLRELR